MSTSSARSRLSAVVAGDRFAGIYMVASAILIPCLAAGFVILAVRNSDIAASVHGNEITACISGNKTRVQEKRILDKVLALPSVSAPPGAGTPAAPAEAGQVARLRAVIAATYTLRDCAALYSAK